MKITVIIPTIGRASLAATLASLDSQTRPADEIIVEQDFDLAGPAKTRNNGARKAHGDVLFFIDDDCVAAPHWIERMATVFENPTIIAASGAVIYRGDKTNLFERAVENPDGRWFMGANCAVRRDAFWKLGGFPEKYRVYEDKAFALACLTRGYAVAQAPTASVYHEISEWTDRMVKNFADHLAWWVDLHADYDLWIDKINPPPLWGVILMPRDYLACAKHLLRFYDAGSRLRAKILFLQRVYLWKHAIARRIILL